MNSLHRNVLFFSDHLPSEAFGGTIVNYRHLSMLNRDGWRVTVVCLDQHLGEQTPPPDWQLVKLPHRNPWWPPIRSAYWWTVSLRASQLASSAAQRLKGGGFDALVTDCQGDYCSLAAARLAKRLGVPLHALYHDDMESWAQNHNELRNCRAINAEVFHAASQIYPVSKQLFAKLESRLQTKATLMQNMPQLRDTPKASWRPEFGKSPCVAYTGTFYPSLYSTFELLAKALEQVNGGLLLIGRVVGETPVGLQSRCPNVSVHEPMPPDELFRFVHENCSAVVVGYSVEPSIEFGLEKSFPVKLCDLAHLHLPVVITTKPDTALWDWAVAKSWPTLIDTPDPIAFERVVESLLKRDEWNRLASLVEAAAKSDFAPERIHQQFVRCLEAQRKGLQAA